MIIRCDFDRRKFVFYLILSLGICCFISFLISQLYAQSSIIEIIQDSLRSIVSIKAENALAEKESPQLAKDPRTGKIVVVQRLKGATYARVGAGVVIDASGIIATNAHIVKGAQRVSVTLSDGTEAKAHVLWVSLEDDLAFLRVTTEVLFVPLGFSTIKTIQLRDTVYTVGGSEMLKGSFIQGKISGVGKRAQAQEGDTYHVDLIQTSFEDMYQGDSGSPLLDRNGKLLGLMVAVKTSTPYVSFAIPSHRIAKYYLEFIKKLGGD